MSKKAHFFKGAELLYNVIIKSYPKKQKLKFLKHPFQRYRPFFFLIDLFLTVQLSFVSL